MEDNGGQQVYSSNFVNKNKQYIHSLFNKKLVAHSNITAELYFAMHLHQFFDQKETIK